MLKGFKDFILKGNVIELATAVIVGAAFTAIVTAFTDGIVQPIINSIPIGADSAQGLGFQITDNPSTFVDLGSVITAVINFLIIAAVVYFIIILPYNKLSELGGFGKKAEVTEVALLTEIRDLLDPEGTSKAKVEAESDLPAHLTDPAGPASDSYGPPSGSFAPYEAPSGAGTTQRISTPPPGSQGLPPHSAPYQSGPSPSAPPQSGQQSGQPQSGQPQSGQPQSTPPQNRPPQGPPPGQPYPTPQPAPGNYPPPGNYPNPGGYPAPGQGSGYPGEQYPGDFPGEGPDAPGRHSR
ncbi:large conductance mechanosensitive channel protein MscL [Gordonia terrae]|uniref:large conductance mechanosensitive channel protein MscL n=1 Tax=Gordonia terrae TaxID=2055 RepID=UPI003F6CF62E